MHSQGDKTTILVMWHHRSFVSYYMKINLGWYVPVLLCNIRMGTLINKTTFEEGAYSKGVGLLEGGR